MYFELVHVLEHRSLFTAPEMRAVAFIDEVDESARTGRLFFLLRSLLFKQFRVGLCLCAQCWLIVY